jgi:chromosome partitioning protein
MQQGELIGLQEVARMAGVGPSAVANWRKRYADFPVPLAELSSGPVFDREQIQRWLRRRRTKVGRTIAMINLKGGVAKTTTTFAVALNMSRKGKRVLVIDLDPQTNVTVMFIGEDRWGELNRQHRTLAQLFQDALSQDGEEKLFNLDATLQRGVGNVTDAATVDLLPSSLDLITVQDRLALMPSGRFFANVPTDILMRATREIIDGYDYVLIDCPPNLGLITLNGLRIADGYVIPTIPDVLSTYGIPQIESRVREFADNIATQIRPFGIALTKYRVQSAIHNNTANLLRNGNGGIHVFNTDIPETTGLAATAEYRDEPATLRQKLGYGVPFDNYRKLTVEIMEAAE